MLINIVVAFMAEAKPLIDYYQLKKDLSAPLPLFTNGTMALVVSGKGKVKSGAATGFIAARSQRGAALLNFGIAGHGSFDIGSVVTAHEIIDQETKKTYFPTRLFSFESSSFMCVQKPSLEYSSYGIDMESSGFFESASLFTTHDLIQVIKLISDNTHNPFDQMDFNAIPFLITQKLPQLNQMINHLMSLTHIQTSSPIEGLSHSNQKKYHRLMQRAKALIPELEEMLQQRGIPHES